MADLAELKTELQRALNDARRRHPELDAAEILRRVLAENPRLRPAAAGLTPNSFQEDHQMQVKQYTFNNRPIGQPGTMGASIAAGREIDRLTRSRMVDHPSRSYEQAYRDVLADPANATLAAVYAGDPLRSAPRSYSASEVDSAGDELDKLVKAHALDGDMSYSQAFEAVTNDPANRDLVRRWSAVPAEAA